MISRVMRVKELTELIREEIDNSDLMPASPIMSAREFAEKYNTSVLTAHRAINNLVDEGLLYRVRGSGSFIAEPQQGEKALTIGICFPSHQGDAAAIYAAFDIYQDTITTKLRKMGHTVVNFTYNDLTDNEYMQNQFIGLDGLILSAACIDEKTYSTLEDSKLNIVTIMHEDIKSFPFHQVVPDLLTGYREALKNLKQNGYSQYIIAANDNIGHQKFRIEAIYSAAQQEGISREQFQELYCEIKLGDSGRMSGQELGHKIIDENKKPFPAVITVSDFVAFGIMDVILQNKLKPGIDISLTSYDDLEGDGFLPFDKPMISSVGNHKKEIAKEAVSILLEAIEHQKQRTTILRIPTNFIQRDSSGVKED